MRTMEPDIEDIPKTQQQIAELESALRRGRKALYVFAPLAVLLTLWALYSYFFYSSSLERAYDAQAQYHARETAEVLRMAALPISSVIRNEMATGSVYGIERFFRQLSTYPGIVQLTLVRNDGKILSSTKQDHQGMEFNRTFRDGFLHGKEVIVDRGDKGIIRVVIPVVDRDITKGVVILIYQKP